MKKYTGQLRTTEELSAMGYTHNYIKSVITFTDGNGIISNMIESGANAFGTKYLVSRYTEEGEHRIEVNSNMFRNTVWLSPAQVDTQNEAPDSLDVPKYSAKGKLKSTNSLVALGIPSLTINMLISSVDEDGFIGFRDTAKPDIVVIGDGWTAPYSIFEHTEYELKNTTGLGGDISESFDEVLEDTLNDVIPKDSLTATEPLNVHCEPSKPFSMSNNLFSKLSKIRNRTHYIKLQLSDPDLSFRLHYTFEDRPHLENKWVLKSHTCKEVIVVNEDFVKLHFKNVIGVTEIFGERIINTTGYSKILRDMVTKEVTTVNER